MKNFVKGFFLSLLIISGAAYASSASQSPFSLLGLNPNFSSGLKIFGVAATPMNIQTFSSHGTGTWTKPTAGGHMAIIEIWSAGASGGVRTTTGDACGGGSGGYTVLNIPLSTLAATETYVVGQGGAAVASSNAVGNNGGASSFTINGVTFTVNGGTGGGNAALAAACSGGSTGYPSTGSGIAGLWGNGAAAIPDGIFGGAGGKVDISNVPYAGGNSIIGGGGGGASSSVTGGTRTGGTSVVSGAGGTGGSYTGGACTAGSAPSGGGGAAVNGAASCAGADGQVRITVF